MAHAELVAALLQSQASPALVQRGEGGHERVLEREDFDSGVRHGFCGPSVLADRDPLALHDPLPIYGSRRRELNSYLRRLPRDHLNLAERGCELRMAHAELVGALLQSLASPALVQRGEGGHERVLE